MILIDCISHRCLTPQKIQADQNLLLTVSEIGHSPQGVRRRIQSLKQMKSVRVHRWSSSRKKLKSSQCLVTSSVIGGRNGSVVYFLCEKNEYVLCYFVVVA